MFKWINPFYWVHRVTQVVNRWENHRRADQLFRQANLMVEEAQQYREGPLKEACMRKAKELADKAFALCDK